MRTTESATAGPAFRRRSEKTFGPVQSWPSSYPAHGGAGTRSGRSRVAPGLAPCTTSPLPFTPGDDGSASSVRRKAMTRDLLPQGRPAPRRRIRRTNAGCCASWKARRSLTHVAWSLTGWATAGGRRGPRRSRPHLHTGAGRSGRPGSRSPLLRLPPGSAPARACRRRKPPGDQHQHVTQRDVGDSGPRSRPCRRR